MKVYPINTGFFKLDGGAMFGVVPKSIWQRTNPADENNMCTWALRCLLVEDGNQLVLVDTGIGNKQDEKFFSYYYLHGNDSLDGALKRIGFSRNEITDVVLSHLHFDHCGGSIQRMNGSEIFEPAFPNAKFWSNQRHWEWAINPNPREKASFLKENILPIAKSGQLNLLQRPNESSGISLSQSRLPFSHITYVDGHTDSMMCPHVTLNGNTIVFMADLLPSTGHIPLPYVMGYDTRPLLTLSEKEKFLNQAADENWILFLEHDSVSECCTVEKTERGVRLKNKGKLEDFIG